MPETNTQRTGEPEEIDTLFKEMREDKIAEKDQKPKDVAKKFEPLPDGDYTGRVYILPDTVANENSPNYGRKKYVIQLTVAVGDSKGKMAYNHRVILPRNFANQPSAENLVELEKWRVEVKRYLRQTDQILTNCGVDTSDTDMNRFTLKIAENNRRNPIVKFTMRGGVPYINSLLSRDKEAAAAGDLFKDQTLPDGADLPL